MDPQASMNGVEAISINVKLETCYYFSLFALKYIFEEHEMFARIIVY